MNMKEFKGVVYCYTNTVNGKKYVGETIHERKRRVNHKRLAKNGCRHKSSFYDAINKYGYDKFIYEVLYSITGTDKHVVKEAISNKEIELIKEFNSFRKGYNLTKGGGGCVGRVVSQAHKDHMSKLYKGKKPSKVCMDATIKKCSKAILQYSKDNVFIAEYSSGAEAARQLNCLTSGISKVLKGVRKTHRGFIFKYK